MMNRFPTYNFVAVLEDGRIRAEVQSASGACDRRHFDTLGQAIAWARRRASEMLPRNEWEPTVYN